MKTKINKIKFFPLYEQKWTVADRRLEYQPSKNKKIVYNKVKELREAIDEFKLEIDPLLALKKFRKDKIEEKRLEQIKIKKKLARNKMIEKLQNYRRSYSDLMVLQQMSRNKKYYRKEIIKIDSIKTGLGFENKTSNNDSKMRLTPFHNSSSMKTINKQYSISIPKFSFNSRSNSKSKVKRLRFKVCTQSTHYDIERDNSRNINNYTNISNTNDCFNKNSDATSRNDKSIRKEIKDLLQSHTVEKPFKRKCLHNPKYSSTKGKVGDDNNSQMKLCHSDTNLGHIAIKSKGIEEIGEGISWTINCEKDKIPFIPKIDSEKKKQKQEYRINFEKEETIRLRSSLGSVKENYKYGYNKFDYSIQTNKQNREYSDYSNLNIIVAYNHRKHYNKKLL